MASSAHKNDNEKKMNTALAITLTILWYIAYPIGITLWYLAFALFFVAKVLYIPIAFLLQPFVHFGRFVVACLGMPFSVAARLETLYIYLSVAAIVGLLGGLFVAGIYLFLRSILNLDAPLLSAEPVRARTAKEYREEKRQKKQVKVEVPSLLSSRHLSPASVSPAGYVSMSSDGGRRGRRSLLATTIMEEEDSEF